MTGLRRGLPLRARRSRVAARKRLDVRRTTREDLRRPDGVPTKLSCPLARLNVRLYDRTDHVYVKDPRGALLFAVV